MPKATPATSEPTASTSRPESHHERVVSEDLIVPVCKEAGGEGEGGHKGYRERMGREKGSGGRGVERRCSVPVGVPGGDGECEREETHRGRRA